MTRLDWASIGTRFFEAGVDRGVLYVGNNPGVPWVGLIAVEHSASGGESKPRYLDGVKIGNHAGPEQFSATIEAFTYPTEFEQCDGTARIENGLRATQQRRKPFGLSYRTKIGNDIQETNHSYKIHILYHLRAEPSDRDYRTLGEQDEPMNFSWPVTSRGELVAGLVPTAHFEVDSRDVPAALFATLEDILYGTTLEDPSLPSMGELIFLFDSFEDLVYDAGSPFTPVFATYDAGGPTTPIIDVIDSEEL